MNPNYSDFTLFLIIKNWKILLFSTIAVFLAGLSLPDQLVFPVLSLAQLAIVLFLAANFRKLFNIQEQNNKSIIYFIGFFLLDIILILIFQSVKIASVFGIFSFLINYYLILSYYPMMVRQLSLQDNLNFINELKSKQFKIVFIAYAVSQLLGSLIYPISLYLYQANVLPNSLLLGSGFIIKVLTYILSISLLSVEKHPEEVEQICKENNYSIKFPYFRLQNACFAGILAISLSLVLYVSPKKLPEGFTISSKMKCSDKQIELELKYKNPNNGFFSPLSFYLAGDKPEERLKTTLIDMKNNENILILKYEVERNKTELSYLDNLNLWYGENKIEKVKCID